ncbi:MAG: hypothetical protein GX269_00290, partial [Clostridiales bacterium]|nr:hypothetical protein [Clostridiales bacterium]
MEYKYSESAQKYKLEECVLKAEEMFEMAIEDTNRAKEEGRYAKKKDGKYIKA